MDAANFLSEFFSSRSTENVCLASYANDRDDTDKLPPVEIYTRKIEQVGQFLTLYDVPGRAVYFCVSTLKKKKRSKANVAEIICLHADLDFKNIQASRKEIEAVLARLPLPASCIVFSGNGIH